jgi:hypothetical protein
MGMSECQPRGVGIRSDHVSHCLPVGDGSGDCAGAAAHFQDAANRCSGYPGEEMRAQWLRPARLLSETLVPIFDREGHG